MLLGSEGTCNNCLFVEVFKYFLKCSNKIFNFLTNNSRFLYFCSWDSVTNGKYTRGSAMTKRLKSTGLENKNPLVLEIKLANKYIYIQTQEQHTKTASTR